MIIVASYCVDKEIYENSCTPHNATMVTTEYTHRNDVLVHLLIGKNLGIRLNNLLQCESRKGKDIQNEHFLIKKSYGTGKPKPTTRSTFEDKLKRFDMDKTVKMREILEEYGYTGKNGKSDTAQIVVIIKDETMIATIDFNDPDHYENFIEPTWLIRPDGRNL